MQLVMACATLESHAFKRNVAAPYTFPRLEHCCKQSEEDAASKKLAIYAMSTALQARVHIEERHQVRSPAWAAAAGTTCP